MPMIDWLLAAVLVCVLAGAWAWSLARAARSRESALEAARDLMRDGVIEREPGRSPRVRGWLGELEVDVEFHIGSKRSRRPAVWRVLAVGPVGVDRPIEARIGGWRDWIDPWLRLGETLRLPGQSRGATIHAEHSVSHDHPFVVSLRRQLDSLPPGALHARPELVRAELRFAAGSDARRQLVAYLQAIGGIVGQPGRKLREPARPEPASRLAWEVQPSP